MKPVIRDNGIEVNRLTQYNRSSFMLEISGIPFNKNENKSNIIQKIVMLTKIIYIDSDVTQVDVAHRTSKRPNAPSYCHLIKNQINYFFKQKKQIPQLTSSSVSI